jgi:predicted DsbA family dithiol-disulfide isomerase
MNPLPTKPIISIDIVSDVACPWCYIGKERLGKAVEALKDQFQFHISFKPFQLDPHIPAEGIPYQSYLAHKFGGIDQLDEVFHRVETIGESLGIDFQFRKIPKALNTLPLHVLLKVAEKEGFQHRLAPMLFEVYMVQPQDLSKPETLVDIMRHFGWEETKTLEILADKELTTAVQNEIKHYQEMGISGVPFFIINNKFGISGAQTTDTFLSAFQDLQPEDFPTPANSCSVDEKC